MIMTGKNGSFWHMYRRIVGGPKRSSEGGTEEGIVGALERDLEEGTKEGAGSSYFTPCISFL